MVASWSKHFSLNHMTEACQAKEKKLRLNLSGWVAIQAVWIELGVIAVGEQSCQLLGLPRNSHALC